MKRFKCKLTETKASELLRRAVADARAAAKMPGVKLNMSEWVSGYKNTCEVCMAGAVMLGMHKSLAIEVQFPSIFADEVDDPDLAEKLHLINAMRWGDSLPPDVSLLIQDHYSDLKGRAPWRIYLKAARMLEERGL